MLSVADLSMFHVEHAGSDQPAGAISTFHVEHSGKLGQGRGIICFLRSNCQVGSKKPPDFGLFEFSPAWLESARFVGM